MSLEEMALELKEIIKKYIDKKDYKGIVSKVTRKNDYSFKLKLFLLNATKFLDKYNPTISQRIYHFYYDTMPSKCKNLDCNNITQYRNLNIGYRDFCSSKCAQVNENTQYKTKGTCLERYGVEHTSQLEKNKNISKEICLLHGFGTDKFNNKIKEKYGVDNISQSVEIQKKKEETCLIHHGVKYSLQSEEIRNKVKDTCLEKYGNEFVSRLPEFRNKIENTCLERYGVKHPSELDEFKNKAKETCMERYGFESSMQSEEIRNKVKDTCLERYGVEYSSQNSDIRDKTIQSSYKSISYILPSGKEVKIQGYEDKFLDEYFNNGGQEDNILIKTKDINDYLGIIWYTTADGKKHRYYPDAYLIKENKIIETKSTYTIKCNIEINELKKQACLGKGLNFEFKVY